MSNYAEVVTPGVPQTAPVTELHVAGGRSSIDAFSSRSWSREGCLCHYSNAACVSNSVANNKCPTLPAVCNNIFILTQLFIVEAVKQTKRFLCFIDRAA
jgi:hypothetical protein